MTGSGRLASEATAIARKLASVAAAGEEGRVNRRLIHALAEEGLLPLLFPPRAGGTSEGDVSTTLASIIICRGAMSIRTRIFIA